MTTTTTLTLSSACPWNTTITDDEGVIQYDVKTEAEQGDLLTFVHNGYEKALATLEWRDLLPDKVTMGGKTMTIGKWLTKSFVPLRHTVSLKDDLGRRYVWHGNAPGLELQLYTEEDQTTPIAYFKKLPGSTSATITLSLRAEEVRDTVVISCLFIEKARRIKEGAYSDIRGRLMGPWSGAA